MKRFFIISALFLTLASCSGETEKTLKKLDEEIVTSDIGLEMTRHKTDSLKSALKTALTVQDRFDNAKDIARIYMTRNADSTARYISLMKSNIHDRESMFLATINEAELTRRNNHLDDALRICMTIDTARCTSSQKRRYMATLCSIYDRLADTTEHIRACREYLMIDTTTSEADVIRYKLAKALGNDEEALETLLSSRHIDNNSRISYHIGQEYYAEGKLNKAICSMANAARRDIHQGNKSYMSLYDLSLMLMEKRKYDRAVKYMDLTLSDRNSMGSSELVETALKSRSFITDAMRQANVFRNLSLILTAAILGGAFAVSIRLLKQSRRHGKVLQKYQERLLEANTIKEKYLFKYMELSTGYITKLNEDRVEYLKTGQKQGLDALLKKLRQVDRHYDTVDDFFKIFDNTFLDIYPDFFDNINQLLEEDHHIIIGEDRQLDIRSRIPALIRLGMDESGQIASFLNCSKATVYTYRSLLKSHAIDKTTFESHIKKC